MPATKTPSKIDPAALAIIQKVRKKHGAESIMLGSEIKNTVTPRITTGSLAFDVALGGGLPANKWSEFIAHPSNGKTALALQTVAANQAVNPDHFTVWFASEEFVVPYAEMNGVDIDRVLVVDTNIMEVVYETATDFLEKRGADLIVVDSLPALAPLRSLSGSMEDLQPGLHAFLTGKFFQQAQPAIKRSLMHDERLCAGIVINQWRQKIMQGPGDPRTTPGGVGKDFYYAIRLDLQRTEWIQNTKGKRIGQTIKMKAVKNKTMAGIGAEAEVDYYFGAGNGHEAGTFDRLKDVIAVASDDRFGVIERRGAYYYVGGETFNGKEALVEGVRDNPTLADQIVNDVMELVQRKASGVVLNGDQPDDGVEESPSPAPKRRTVARKKA